MKSWKKNVDKLFSNLFIFLIYLFSKINLDLVARKVGVKKMFATKFAINILC